jgi:hypothetical protein
VRTSATRDGGTRWSLERSATTGGPQPWWRRSASRRKRVSGERRRAEADVEEEEEEAAAERYDRERADAQTRVKCAMARDP